MSDLDLFLLPERRLPEVFARTKRTEDAWVLPVALRLRPPDLSAIAADDVDFAVATGLTPGPGELPLEVVLAWIPWWRDLEARLATEAELEEIGDELAAELLDLQAAAAAGELSRVRGWTIDREIGRVRMWATHVATARLRRALRRGEAPAVQVERLVGLIEATIRVTHGEARRETNEEWRGDG